MKTLVNSLVLAIINIFSILVGFCIYYILRTPNQVALQAPVACFISVMGFLLWGFLCWKLVRKIHLESNTEHIKTYFFTFLWTPIIFVPLHYFTQGYLTSMQNITGIWLFQIPTNLLVVTVYLKFSKLLKYTSKLIVESDQTS